MLKYPPVVGTLEEIVIEKDGSTAWIINHAT
jgi:hypothetical protein